VRFIRKGRVRCFSELEPAGRILEGGDSFGLEGVESIIEREAAGGDASAGRGDAGAGGGNAGAGGGNAGGGGGNAGAGGGDAGAADARGSMGQAAPWSGLSQRALKVVQSHHTCVAVTYCDLMSLALHDLSELLARETSWADLGALPPRKEALSSFRRASRLLSKLGGGMRKSRPSSSEDTHLHATSQHAVSFGAVNDRDSSGACSGGGAQQQPHQTVSFTAFTNTALREAQRHQLQAREAATKTAPPGGGAALSAVQEV
jgi:hypothetical protein